MNAKTSHEELKGGRAVSWPDRGGYGRGNQRKGRAPYAFRVFGARGWPPGASQSLSISPASLRLLCLYSPNKGKLISSNYRGVLLWGFGQKLVYVWQARSRGRAAPPCAPSAALRWCTQQPREPWPGTSSLTCHKYEFSLWECFWFSTWIFFFYFFFSFK